MRAGGSRKRDRRVPGGLSGGRGPRRRRLRTTYRRRIGSVIRRRVGTLVFRPRHRRLMMFIRLRRNGRRLDRRRWHRALNPNRHDFRRRTDGADRRRNWTSGDFGPWERRRRNHRLDCGGNHRPPSPALGAKPLVIAHLSSARNTEHPLPPGSLENVPKLVEKVNNQFGPNFCRTRYCAACCCVINTISEFDLPRATASFRIDQLYEYP